MWNGAARQSYQRQYQSGTIFGAFGRVPTLPLCMPVEERRRPSRGAPSGASPAASTGRITSGFDGSLVLPAASVAITR